MIHSKKLRSQIWKLNRTELNDQSLIYIYDGIPELKVKAAVREVNSPNPKDVQWEWSHVRE